MLRWRSCFVSLHISLTGRDVLSLHRVANDTDDYALDGQCLFAEIHLNRRKLRVLRHQPDAMPFLSIAFDGDFVVQARDDDLSCSDVGCSMHRNQIAVQNAGIAHAHAVHAKQKVRRLLEQIGIDLITSLDVFLGENRLTRCDASNERQADLLAQRIFESNAARHTGQKLDDAFALERAQMLLGRVDGAKFQRLGNFGTRRRHARFVHSLLNQKQNLPLPRSEIAHGLRPVYKISMTLYTARRLDESSECDRRKKSLALAALRMCIRAHVSANDDEYD